MSGNINCEVYLHSLFLCRRDSREPLDRRRDEPPLDAADALHDERYTGCEPSSERHLRDIPMDHMHDTALDHHREPDIDRHRDFRDHGYHGDQVKDMYPGESAEQERDRDRHRRGSLGRSRGDRMGHDLDDHHDPRYAQDMTSGIAAERHPERLMRGHMPVSPKDIDTYEQYGAPPQSLSSRRDHRDRDDFGDMEMELDHYPDQSPRQHLDPSSAVAKTSRSRRKLDSMLRNDSLSSDPSDCVRPPPPKPHKHKKGKKQRQASLSSSDDEIQTTPECTSCDEQEIESESVSEKGKSV